MNVPRELKIVLMLAITVAMFAFATAEEAFMLAGVLWVLSATGWWLTEFTAAIKGVSRVWIIAAFACIGLYTFLSVMEDGVVVSLFNTAIALLIGVKVWERREIRDYGQILTLTMFLAIGSTLNRNSLGVGLALLILVPTLAYGAMLCQLAAGRAKASISSHSEADSRVGRLGMMAAAAGFFISLVVFVLVPRGISPPAGFSAFGRLSATRVSGLSDHVRLGQGGLINESQSVVMTMRMLDADGQPLGGEGQIQYLRACVLDEYRNGLWSRSDGPAMRDYYGNSWEPINIGYLRAQSSMSDVAVTQYFEVRSASSAETPIAALYRPITLRESPYREQVWSGSETRTRYRIDALDASTVRAGAPGPMSYMVTSIINAPEPPRRSRRGEVSFPSEELGVFAREVLVQAGLEPDAAKRPTEDDAIAARAFESALRTNCEYSLDTPAAPFDVDPTEWFVLTQKSGHCEYFASALAGMCRSVGIDARVITGYIATQFDSDLGSYVIREANAHAWVEVNTAPNVWRVFDATPPADFARQHGSPEGVLSRIGRLLGDLEDLWSAQVVSFDSSAQTDLLGARGRRMITEDWGASARAGIRDVLRLEIEFAGFDARWLALIAPVLFGVVIVRVVRGRVRGGPVHFDRQAMELHASILEAFEYLGVPRSPSVPLETHALIARDVDPVAGSLIAEAISSLNRATFGATVPDSVEWGRIRRGLARYRRSKFRLFRLGGLLRAQTKTDSTIR